MKKSKIYTKKGDAGTTSIVGGFPIQKSDIRLEAYGTVDELNSFLGYLITWIDDIPEKQQLQWIQDRMFTIGTCLATDRSRSELSQQQMIQPADIERIEAEIDRMDAQLPPLKTFVMPGGCRAAAVSHLCRTVCRRMERRVIALSEIAPVDILLTAFVNRLSDYLFVLSRYLNSKNQTEESFRSTNSMM